VLNGSREYEFSVEEPEPHRVVLVIRNANFCGKLTFQEGPSLCYQKLYAEIDSAGHTSFAETIEVTAADCARYHEAHLSGGKPRSGSGRARTPGLRDASLDIGASSVRRRPITTTTER
jgi:hypothetical protein